MKRFALTIILLTAVGAAVFLALNWPGAEASPGVTITVNYNSDYATGPDSWMTLREAMKLATGELSLSALTEAECDQVSPAIWAPPSGPCWSLSPPGAASADTIVFGTSVFPPANPKTITLSAPLPGLTEGDDTVDGSSAGVVVDGGGVDYCFGIASDDNVVKGLEIYNCSRAVLIEGGRGNIIGGSSSGERNVISGNDYGVVIEGGEGNVVKGNHIGTNAAGTAAVPNGLGVVDGVGVRMQGGVQNNTVEGNVISGNDGAGVAMEGSATNGNTVKGNYIGTNADGTAAIPNAGGVYISGGAQNIIGGSTAGERNVISGNDYCGVLIVGADGNTVKGNYIGTNADGTAAIPNASGVDIAHGVQNNSVGGSTTGEGNVISGNDTDGVTIWDDANGNVVKGNFIGTDASGTAALPNGWNGVNIWNDAQNNTVGGTAAGEGNVIAYNNDSGVRVYGWLVEAINNTIRGNSIHSNGEKGIENYEGGNTELPPPTITGFGSLMGTACAYCTIDIYSDEEDEGRVYEGSTTADGDGNWSFSGTPEGPNITATATDSDGNTSEFSVPLEPPWPTPAQSPTATATPTVSPTPVSDSDGDTVADDLEEALGSDPNDSDSTPEHAAMPGTCSDGVDNDGDGLTDAEDEGCRATRTLVWGPGWHNVTWTGASTPEEAFACAAGNYAAAYRLVSGGWERYFPDRPDLSNMTDLEPYDVFLILITGDVTCEMPVAGALGTERTLDWGVGWQNDGWTGADGMPPEDAFECAEGSYAAAYRLVGGGWERYFPDRPEISNMGSLDKYDAFLILTTVPVSCSMPIAP
jgi:parallel beta-helix repeat protein